MRIAIAALLLLVASPALARGGGYRAPRMSAGCCKHTASHGGSYVGGSGGSSHRGGHYFSPSTGNRYRRHK